MTLDEIRTQLENAEDPPEEALTAAVGQAAALAPDMIRLMSKVTDGICLLPKQENLLFFGLHALAAARESSAYPAFVALLRRPEHELERLFGDGLTETGAGLLLGLYDGDADPLYEAIDDPATDGMVKWSLFQVLARLAWEGRTPRDRLVALIDRFDRHGMAPPGDAAWEGWQDAIMYLGLEAFEERVRAGWKAGRMPFQNDADRRDWNTRLERAIAHLEDPQRFIDDHVVPVTDPVASLAWTAQTRGVAKDSSADPADPAQAIKLSANEQDWLACFLASEQAPANALDLEQLDGFFTALVAGLVMVMPSEYMGRIWGTENGEGPVFDSREQAEFVTTLLMRHWNSIAVRLDARCPHFPFMFAARPEDRGRGWAEGFILGLYLRRDAWTPLMDHEDASVLVGSITALVADAYGQNDGTLTPKMRADFLDALPATILAISSFWKDGTVPRLRSEPVRSAKIGRNEPCPCGSGKKYKRCCGANSNAPRP